MIDLLKRDVGVDVWETYGEEYLFGTWIKKETYEVHGYVVPATGKVLDTPVVRRRLRTGSFNWANYSDTERAEFVAAKLWPTGDRAPPKHPLSSPPPAPG
jgi:tRNA(His) guanylyltransferase